MMDDEVIKVDKNRIKIKDRNGNTWADKRFDEGVKKGVSDNDKEFYQGLLDKMGVDLEVRRKNRNGRKP